VAPQQAGQLQALQRLLVRVLPLQLLLMLLPPQVLVQLLLLLRKACAQLAHAAVNSSTAMQHYLHC
jgi:hypothetical protein